MRRHRRTFLGTAAWLMASLLGVQGAAAAELATAGWHHETTRLIFRMKLTLSLPFLAAPLAQWDAFMAIATHWSLAVLCARGAGDAQPQLGMPFGGPGCVAGWGGGERRAARKIVVPRLSLTSV